MRSKIFISNGQRFGKLKVVNDSVIFNGLRGVSCICDCGKVCSTSIYQLTGGIKKSCGCLKRSDENKAAGPQEAKRKLRVEFAHHQDGGRLTFLWERLRNQKRYAICRCDCGNFTEVLVKGFVHNKTKSCGCAREDQDRSVFRAIVAWRKVNQIPFHIKNLRQRVLDLIHCVIEGQSATCETRREIFNRLGFNKDAVLSLFEKYSNKECVSKIANRIPGYSGGKCLGLITKERFSVDHIMPLSSITGGTFSIDDLFGLKNTRLICRPCNLAKSDMTIRYKYDLDPRVNWITYDY